VDPLLTNREGVDYVLQDKTGPPHRVGIDLVICSAYVFHDRETVYL